MAGVLSLSSAIGVTVSPGKTRHLRPVHAVRTKEPSRPVETEKPKTPITVDFAATSVAARIVRGWKAEPDAERVTLGGVMYLWNREVPAELHPVARDKDLTRRMLRILRSRLRRGEVLLTVSHYRRFRGKDDAPDAPLVGGKLSAMLPYVLWVIGHGTVLKVRQSHDTGYLPRRYSTDPMVLDPIHWTVTNGFSYPYIRQTEVERFLKQGIWNRPKWKAAAVLS